MRARPEGGAPTVTRLPGSLLISGKRVRSVPWVAQGPADGSR
jgi:hypothetical protein